MDIRRLPDEHKHRHWPNVRPGGRTKPTAVLVVNATRCWQTADKSYIGLNAAAVRRHAS